MSFIGSILGFETSHELRDQQEPLRNEEVLIREELSKLKKELDAYSGDGYTRFHGSILVPEKQRLAALLIETTDESSEGRDARLMIRGQYNEVCRLIGRGEEIRAEILACEHRLLDTLKGIAELDDKIKRAKAREE